MVPQTWRIAVENPLGLFPRGMYVYLPYKSGMYYQPPTDHAISHCPRCTTTELDESLSNDNTQASSLGHF